MGCCIHILIRSLLAVTDIVAILNRIGIHGAHYASLEEMAAFGRLQRFIENRGEPTIQNTKKEEKRKRSLAFTADGALIVQPPKVKKKIKRLMALSTGRKGLYPRRGFCLYLRCAWHAHIDGLFRKNFTADESR